LAVVVSTQLLTLVCLSVGSLKNVDMDDKSAMIRRFINPAVYTTSHQWDDGEIWARGAQL
jgi:hypothetical protein